MNLRYNHYLFWVYYEDNYEEQKSVIVFKLDKSIPESKVQSVFDSWCLEELHYQEYELSKVHGEFRLEDKYWSASGNGWKLIECEDRELMSKKLEALKKKNDDGDFDDEIQILEAKINPIKYK